MLTPAATLHAGGLLMFGTLLFQDPSALSCQDRFVREIQNCRDMFNNADPQNPDSFQNADAYEACLEGADDSFSACDDGADRPGLYGAWIAFTAALRQCLEQYPDDDDPAQLACIRVELKKYRDAVKELMDDIDDDDEECASGVIVSQFGTVHMAGPMDTLRAAAHAAGIADGKPIVEVGSTIRFAAGLNGSDHGYDVAEIECIQSAVLLVGHRTPDGVSVRAVDADGQVRDGVEFEAPLIADRLVASDQVSLLAVFFDADGVPRLAEFGKVRLAESEVPGDWNRDGVRNTRDMSDYFGAYYARVPRADLTGDDAHDAADVHGFLETFTD